MKAWIWCGVFLIMISGAVAGPAIADDELQTDSMIVVGEHQRPDAAAKRAQVLVPTQTTVDPGMPEQDNAEAQVPATSKESGPAKGPSGPGAPGRAKDSRGFPWWMLIVVGGVAVAVL